MRPKIERRIKSISPQVWNEIQRSQAQPVQLEMAQPIELTIDAAGYEHFVDQDGRISRRLYQPES